MKSIFEKPVVDEVIGRMDKLSPHTQAQWGKMNVAQMLAHCNVTYELVYDNIHKKPNALMKFILKSFVKDTVVNEKPYKKSSQTAPEFLIKGERDFDKEKKRLVDYIQKTQQLGPSSFDQKESQAFGKLSISEWNNMFYKHLDHHLGQFGV